MSLELLKEGFLVLLIGMGFVYVFIAIMIWVMNISAKIMKFINKYFPEEVEEEKYTPKKKSDNNDAEIALAIACAVAERSRAC